MSSASRQVQPGQQVTPLELFFDLVHGRPTATVVLIALMPVATIVPAVVALALVTAVCATLILYEALRYREHRAWIRDRRGAFTIEEAREIARNPRGAPRR